MSIEQRPLSELELHELEQLLWHRQQQQSAVSMEIQRRYGLRAMKAAVNRTNMGL